ncbi:hypothetical protein GPDM_00740 [Planococcus donghaensis MPA1U2]|uniref:DUF1259 domain-containing protein n=1 Tax=Planococcus donghaensis MPA1U2 TaxID=933115 RepID=E7RCI6_9BACL|nr:DUF1259 domain-containing protein [Planococcus donghaensis]EGA91351.1 hypothetical protein GPDM_00740 [Planococcus donghaensis MPA1U2]
MESLERLAEQVGVLLNAEVEAQNGECLIKKTRAINISSQNKNFNCVLDHDISFKNLKEDGTALNQAEILLLPEELTLFTNALHEHPIPLPINYQQRVDINPNIVCIYMSSEESPEDFATRLSAVFSAIEQKSLVK